MRIISGKFKGKNINFLKNKVTRPLKDFVKENIFNILLHSNLINVDIKNSNILDLYSGVGSFGLECISRGAKKVTFVEDSKISAKILDENLRKLSMKSKYEVYNISTESFFKKEFSVKFDVFFLDPPFSDIKFLQDIKLIKDFNLYKKNHIVIIHREKKTLDKFEKFLNIKFTKTYGRSKIIFATLIE